LSQDQQARRLGRLGLAECHCKEIGTHKTRQFNANANGVTYLDVQNNQGIMNYPNRFGEMMAITIVWLK
jgi:hypothetical protein